MTGALLISAPAKVNLHLAVGSRRPDGYHDVVTVMQALELADSVRVTPADSLEVRCIPDLGVPEEENLATRAILALSRSVGREPDLAIEVAKRIPAGGGLGGGSADAAAVLCGAAILWGIPPSDARVLEAAISVGADVPFFLGGGTALLGGRGDSLERRLPTPELDVVLVNAGIPVSTAEAYAAFDRTQRRPSPSADGMIGALAVGSPEAVAAELFNGLSEVALALAPGMGEAVALLGACGGVLGTAVAGSGSSVFGICRDAGSAHEAADRARERGMWAAATRTIDHGVSIVGESGS